MPRITQFEYEENERKHGPKRESVNVFQQATKDASLSYIRESELQQEIEDWLKTQSHRIWWSRSRVDKPTTGRAGVPDFLICFSGLFVACEVKRPGKKPTLEQNGELAWIRKAGGIECVATSLSEVQALIELLTYRAESEKQRNELVSKHLATPGAKP